MQFSDIVLYLVVANIDVPSRMHHRPARARLFHVSDAISHADSLCVRIRFHHQKILKPCALREPWPEP